MNNLIPAMAYVDNKREQVYKNVEQTGVYDNNLKICNQANFEYFNKDLNRLADSQIELLKTIDYIFNIAENYYVINYIAYPYNSYKWEYGSLSDSQKKNTTN